MGGLSSFEYNRAITKEELRVNKDIKNDCDFKK